MTDEMNRLVDKAASALEAAGAKEVHVFGSGSMDPPNNDLIGDIVRRIVETVQPEKIILFGSRWDSERKQAPVKRAASVPATNSLPRSSASPSSLVGGPSGA